MSPVEKYRSTGVDCNSQIHKKKERETNKWFELKQLIASLSWSLILQGNPEGFSHLWVI